MPRCRNGICQLVQFWKFRPTGPRAKFWLSSVVLAVICFNFFAIFVFSVSIVYKRHQQAAILVQNDAAGTNNEAPKASRLFSSILVNISEDTPDEIVATNVIAAILNKFKDEHGDLSQSLLQRLQVSANLTLTQPVKTKNDDHLHEETPENVKKSPIKDFGLPEPPIPDSAEEKTTAESEEKPVVEQRTLPASEVRTEKPAPTINSSVNDSRFDLLKTRKPEVLPEKKGDELQSCIQYSQKAAAGALKPLMEEITPEKLAELFPQVKEGGHYAPTKCIAKEKTAILIPYRNRYSHLHILLHNLIPLMLRQEVDFTIFVIDQALPDPFNRGMLFNVGFLEALKVDKNFNCFIYHDVDLIPINYSNYYHCNEAPTHFLAGVNKYHYKLLYSNMFGGVTAFTKEQFQKINGASNLYFGWGGEDDDLHKRVTEKGYTPLRTSNPVGLYDMIKHQRDSKNDKNPSRGQMLKTAKKRMDVEGLNTVKYKTLKVEALPIYTWVTVHINLTEVLATAPRYMHKEIAKLRNSQSGTSDEKEKQKDRLDIIG